MLFRSYAHYGIRNKKYKLIYWYNEGLGSTGSQPGGETPEWELFDCENDPKELFNLANKSEYQETLKQLIEILDSKMAEIGDIPRH